MTDIPYMVSRMSKLSYFAELSPADQQKIVHAGTIVNYSANETVFNEGIPCSGMFVLISGEVFLKKNGPGGQCHTIQVLAPVSMFNEVSVLDRGNNPVSALTSKDSVIWRINQSNFLNIISRNSSLAMGLLAMMAKRNRSILSQYEDISFLTVHGRLAKLLIELSSRDGDTIFRENHSTQELAERIGTVPEVLCRAMKSLKDRGLIDTSRFDIKVIDKDILSKIACCD